MHITGSATGNGRDTKLRLAALLLPALLGTSMHALGAEDGWGLMVDASLASDNNVTRSKVSADKLQDSFYSVNVSKAWVHPLAARSRLIFAGNLGGEQFQTYNGLNHLSASMEGEYQYRESSDFYTPTYGIFARLVLDDYESDVRDGTKTSIGVSARNTLTDRISAFTALTYSERTGRSAVFSGAEGSLRMNLDYALRARQTIYFGAEYRQGDVVSTGRSNLESVTIAKVFVSDNAFTGGQFFSYRVNASTWLTTIGYNLALGRKGAVDFSWRHIESTPDTRPSWATSDKSYVTDQLFATLLIRF